MARTEGFPYVRGLPGPLDRLAARLAPAWRGSPAPASGADEAQLLRPAFWLLLVVVAGVATAHLVNRVLGLDVTHVDAAVDQSLNGWTGSILTALTAWGALQLALLRPSLARPMLVVGVLCAWLSLDDMLALHELAFKVARSLGLYASAGYLWPLVYSPLLGTVAYLLARTARSLHPTAGAPVLTGLMCLGLALCLEASVPLLYASGVARGSVVHGIEQALEESLESFGWGVIALGLFAAGLGSMRARVLLGAPPGSEQVRLPATSSKQR